MSMSSYVKSGQPGAILLYWPLFFLPACILAAAAYSYAVVYIPIVGMVSFLLLGGFVFALVTVSGWAFRKAKCRSPLAGRILGLVGGVIALGAAWLFFLHALLNRSGEEGLSLLQLALHPILDWELIGTIAETGWFSIKNAQIQGWAAWSLWGVEAFVILISMLVWSDMAVQREMFCERCDEWVPVEKVETRSVPAGMSAGDFKKLDGSSVLALPENSDPGAPVFVAHEHLACPRCGITRGHRLKMMTTKVDKKGKESVETTEYPSLLLERA